MTCLRCSSMVLCSLTLVMAACGLESDLCVRVKEEIYSLSHTQKSDSSPHDAITKVKEQSTMLEQRKQVMEHKANQVPSLCARLLRNKPFLPPWARREGTTTITYTQTHEHVTGAGKPSCRVPRDHRPVGDSPTTEDTDLCALRGHNTRVLQTSANAFCACNGNICFLKTLRRRVSAKI